MLLADVHCHLHSTQFENDLAEVIKRAEQTGVRVIIENGTTQESNRITLALSKKFPIIKPALGLYPITEEKVPKTLTTAQANVLLEMIEQHRNEIIAIGEVGMDYKWTRTESDKKQQKQTFARVIQLSEKIKKPLIIHSRNAEQDVLESLQTSNVKYAVLHCFSANKKLITRAADMNLTFSIPPIITRLKHFQELVAQVNISQLLTETDAPYLGPLKNERNEPANVLESINEIAKTKKLTPEETANILWMNYQRIFSSHKESR